MPESGFAKDVGIIGGCGHVGLPLALTFATCGMKTVIYDLDTAKSGMVRAGQMPFAEEGGPETLRRALDSGNLEVSNLSAPLADCRFLVLVIGTPLDEYLNPMFHCITQALQDCRDGLRSGQTLILRSTVFPGISAHTQAYLRTIGLEINVAFCPERVAQGHSLREFRELPQIISAFDASTLRQARELFAHFAPDFVEMEPMEAELAKLMTNSWRYIQFATINQFYMIASQHGLNFNRILEGCRFKYPRTAGMPGPGFAAGPCLRKDTMQLAAFSHNSFVLGHSAMLINEGLPYHLIGLLRAETSLADKTVGILGMAFKAESDDVRDSLSYKLKKLLLLEARRVMCSDPYVQDSGLASLEKVLGESDVIIIGAPHRIYRELKIPERAKLVDIWNCVGRAVQ